MPWLFSLLFSIPLLCVNSYALPALQGIDNRGAKIRNRINFFENYKNQHVNEQIQLPPTQLTIDKSLPKTNIGFVEIPSSKEVTVAPLNTTSLFSSDKVRLDSDEDRLFESKVNVLWQAATVVEALIRRKIILGTEFVKYSGAYNSETLIDLAKNIPMLTTYHDTLSRSLNKARLKATDNTYTVPVEELKGGIAFMTTTLKAIIILLKQTIESESQKSFMVDKSSFIANFINEYMAYMSYINKSKVMRPDVILNYFNNVLTAYALWEHPSMSCFLLKTADYVKRLS